MDPGWSFTVCLPRACLRGALEAVSAQASPWSARWNDHTFVAFGDGTRLTVPFLSRRDRGQVVSATDSARFRLNLMLSFPADRPLVRYAKAADAAAFEQSGIEATCLERRDGRETVTLAGPELSLVDEPWLPGDVVSLLISPTLAIMSTAFVESATVRDFVAGLAAANGGLACLLGRDREHTALLVSGRPAELRVRGDREQVLRLLLG